jgi:hypothetical protein
MIRVLCRLFFLLLVPLSLSSTAQAAGPWTGRIVDFDTGEPVEGVVVLAVWERTIPGIGDAVDRFHRAYETVTDRDGQFEIPAYTAINLLPFISPIHGPYVMIFKPGYLYWRRSGATFLGPDDNRPVKEVPGDYPLHHYKFRFGAHYLALPKLKTREERLENLPGLSGIDGHLIPLLVQAINKERRKLGLQPFSILPQK